MTGHSIAGSNECSVCGGPCREPFRLGPVHDNYPFMSPEAIKMTQQRADTEVAEAEPEQLPAGRRRGGRMVRPAEDRAHRPGEDR